MSKMVTVSELVQNDYINNGSLSANQCPTVTKFENDFRKNGYSFDVSGYGTNQLFPLEAISETKVGWMTVVISGGGNKAMWSSYMGVDFTLSNSSDLTTNNVGGSMSVEYGVQSPDYPLNNPGYTVAYVGCKPVGSTVAWTKQAQHVLLSEGCILYITVIKTSSPTAIGSISANVVAG